MILLNCLSQDKCTEKLNVPFTHKRTIDIECSHGHKNRIVFQSELFELFFDFGCMALMDGYYREAIFNFNLALERFREFFIKALLIMRGFQCDSIKKVWGAMKSQSERQLGAYMVLYLDHFKENCDFKAMAMLPEIRNSIIHKGEFPEEKAAHEFGGTVFEHIKFVFRDMITKGYFRSGRICEMISLESQLNPNSYPSISIAIPGFQALHVRDFDLSYSFQNHLDELKAFREHEGSWYFQ